MDPGDATERKGWIARSSPPAFFFWQWRWEVLWGWFSSPRGLVGNQLFSSKYFAGKGRGLWVIASVTFFHVFGEGSVRGFAAGLV